MRRAAASAAPGIALVLLAAAIVGPSGCVGPSKDETHAVDGSGAREGRAALMGTDGRRPNLLLITVDTLRADHLGSYGYPRPTSPSIDQLAAEGVVFENAFTPVPTTAPAIASLLTGRHLDGHGVRSNRSVLADELDTLGEALAAAGYTGAGFFGNGALRFGFGQGLEVWQWYGERGTGRDSDGVDQALAWLAQNEKGPWFLWLHFMDPHGPYDSSPATLSEKLDYPASAELQKTLPWSTKNWGFGVLPRYQQLEGHVRVVDYVRRYDGELIGMDTGVGRLRRALVERGELDDTLIVLTADHGESLGEGNYYFQHGRSLNEPSLRVPLIFRHPELSAGKRISSPASLLDVYPTLASLLGLRSPPEADGIDLAVSDAGPPAQGRDLIAYSVVGNGIVALRHEPWKLLGVLDPRDAESTRFARLVLYDLATDQPLLGTPSAQQRDAITHLYPLLERAALHARSAVERGRQVDAAERARLGALGYVD